MNRTTVTIANADAADLVRQASAAFGGATAWPTIGGWMDDGTYYQEPGVRLEIIHDRDFPEVEAWARAQAQRLGERVIVVTHERDVPVAFVPCGGAW